MVRPNNSNDKDAGSVFPAKPDDVVDIDEVAIIFSCLMFFVGVLGLFRVI